MPLSVFISSIVVLKTDTVKDGGDPHWLSILSARGIRQEAGSKPQDACAGSVAVTAAQSAKLTAPSERERAREAIQDRPGAAIGSEALLGRDSERLQS